MSKTTDPKGRFVIVCTTYKGVFAGWAEDTTGDRIFLTEARMAIYWGTTRGVMELAETGPTDKSTISAKADIEVRGVTAVFECAAKSVEKWQKS